MTSLLCRLCVLLALPWTAVALLKPGSASSIADWGAGVLDTSLRLWDEPWLRRGAGVTHYEQLLPLVRRLDAGLPITVVALGSSIVAGAGCFNPPEQLLQHVHRVRERSNPSACAPPQGKPRGWLGAVLSAVNATWPHPEHLLVNLGQPAVDLANYARRWCFTGTLPNNVDLFIVEQHGGAKEAGLLVEQLFIQLATHGRERRRPPAFLFLSASFAVEPWSTPDEERMSQCLRSGCADATANCSDFRTAWFTPGTTSTLGNAAEDAHGAVMHMYGFSEISIRSLLVGATRDRLFNMSSPCALAHLFYSDGIHPSTTGGLLFADLLIKHLKESVAFAAEVAASGQHHLHVLRLPAAPLHDGAWHTPLRRCYDVETSVDLPVVNDSTTGWRWVVEQAAHGEYVKPGWISQQDAGVLSVRFSTVLRPNAISENVTLVVQYLTTYEHIGNATVACTAGCSCEPLLLVGLDTRGRVSLETSATVNVTQAPHCTVSVTSHLSPRSGSGVGEELASSDKFKILGIAVQTYIELGTDLCVDEAHAQACAWHNLTTDRED